MKDPIGQAILDYVKKNINKDIIVKSDICDDDVIPSAYLFRSYEEMPAIEQVALKRCSGETLDVGAAAGIHASYLKERGLEVHCIDISEKSVDYLKSNGHSAECIDFFDVEDQKYDTVLMLMNGLGIAGSLSNLELLLLKAKSLLTENGKIIADSSDIKYLYQDEDEDGAMWLDLNAEYYGNFKFQMVYGEHTSDWFDWLYVDFEKLEIAASKIGLSVNKMYDENDHYLVEMTIIN
ncbi:MAG TPA: class I SAM-dependent methyltransferase [Crocinitomicaceae bacterium]|nr:class I SAM-dependent methyltransferase [Crocinitomicaceae bacterium]